MLDECWSPSGTTKRHFCWGVKILVVFRNLFDQKQLYLFNQNKNDCVLHSPTLFWPPLFLGARLRRLGARRAALGARRAALGAFRAALGAPRAASKPASLAS